MFHVKHYVYRVIVNSKKINKYVIFVIKKCKQSYSVVNMWIKHLINLNMFHVKHILFGGVE